MSDHHRRPKLEGGPGPRKGSQGRPGGPEGGSRPFSGRPGGPPGGRPTGRPSGGPMGGPMGGHRGPMAMMKGDKARDFKGTLRRLIAALGVYRAAIVAVLSVAVGSTVFAILGPKMLGRATTSLFEGALERIAGTGSINFAFIGRIVLIVLGLYLVSALANYFQGWIMAGISARVTYKFRRDIDEKINRMPLKYFDGTSHGEVLSRITNDVDTVNRTLSQSLSQIVTSVATVIGVLVMMLTISWLMTLVTLIVLPISTVVVMTVVRKSQKYFREQQEYIGHINGHVEEMFGGHSVMKAFNGEKRSIAKFRGLNDTLYISGWKSQFLSGLMFPVMMFVGNLDYVAVSILGGWLAVRRAITVGDIQAFIQYVRNFTQPLTQIANISNVLQQTAAAAERVFEFLDEEEHPPDPKESARVEQFAGRVEFRNVQFGYSPDAIIIKDFSAEVHPGNKIAIVGPTGAGKTTIVKLLMRFYDVTDGSILVTARDVREFRRSDLRNMFGMVLQETWLFNGTIMENIRYGRPGATDEQVIQAAKTAHADHFIRSHPHGYDMVVNEEANNLSQGQMQLLTIARAILSDAKMLILDEATSSVDSFTETLIQRAMDTLMQGRTSFIIAHRLSTIRNADLILVMKDGGIVEQGTHCDLLERGDFYAELYNSQFDVTPVV